MNPDGDKNMSYTSALNDKKTSRNQRFTWLRSQRNRQGFSVLLIALLIGFMVAASADWVFLSSALLLVVMGGWWLLRISVRHVADVPNEELDERLLAVRNQMFRAAYITVTGLVAILWVLASVMVGREGVVVTTSLTYGVGFGFFWLMMILPTVFYAWTEPEV